MAIISIKYQELSTGERRFELEATEIVADGRITAKSLITNFKTLDKELQSFIIDGFAENEQFEICEHIINTLK